MNNMHKKPVKSINSLNTPALLMILLVLVPNLLFAFRAPDVKPKERRIDKSSDQNLDLKTSANSCPFISGMIKSVTRSENFGALFLFRIFKAFFPSIAITTL